MIESPGVLWRSLVQMPHDVSYYMKWGSIDPGEVLALERAAVSTVTKCADRVTFLQSPPQATFGIISAERKVVFILPKHIELSLIEPLLERLQGQQSKCHFIINTQSAWKGFQLMCQSTAGIVRGMIEDNHFKPAEPPVESLIDETSSPITTTPNPLYPSLLQAIEENGEKIVILLSGDEESTIVAGHNQVNIPLTPEQFDILRDKLAGSLLNITVGMLIASNRALAERLILLNKNPYNRIIENGRSVDVDDADSIRQDASRILQFCKTVRSGTNLTKITAEPDDPGEKQLDLLPPDSRINLSVRDWLRLNGQKARGLDIYKCLDVVGSSKKSYVAVLNKEIESRAMKDTPGLIDVVFPDGTTKLIHYDSKKVEIILQGLGHLLRSLTQIRSAVVDRGLGFIPGK